MVGMLLVLFLILALLAVGFFVVKLLIWVAAVLFALWLIGFALRRTRARSGLVDSGR
jgi:hypothetical protein